MADLIPVTIPLLNPNESEVLLAALSVKDGQQVNSGEPLAVLETTKSTGELCAETGGYVLGLHASPGSTLHSGDILCYLSTDPHAALPERQTSVEAATVLPPPLRITTPALVLARQHNLDLAQFSTAKLVTEAAVRQLIGQSEQAVWQPGAGQYAADALIIYGGGGHGKALIDLVRAACVYHPVGVVDDGLLPGSEVLGVPVLGGGAALAGLKARGASQALNAVGGIGNLAPRLEVFKRLAMAGFTNPSVVHPTAVVEPSASLAEGVQVFALAYIGSSAKVGFGSIVNTGAILSHDVVIGAYSNLSPGAILAGAVQVGERVLIGMGVTINLEVKIGSGARIGNGATIKADVPPGGMVHAGSVWPVR